MTSGNDDRQQRPQRLTISQTAHELGVSRWTVRRMIDDGELAATEVRGMLRVDRTSVTEYVQQHRHNNKGAE